MSRFHKSLCASLCALSLSFIYADAPGMDELMPDAMGELSSPAHFVEPVPVVVQAEPPAATEQKPAAKPKAAKAVEAPFTAFTGKVKARKVRMRLHPDTDSRIIKELNKNDLLSVIGEKGDFWAVEPSPECKAFIFRSFVLDEVVEGNRVNVRLEPNLDAPVIGHLNAGDHIGKNVISAQNNKWLEIAPPPQTRFFVAKDFIEYAGGPEVKAQFDKRCLTVEQLLDANSLLSQSELRKPFDEIDFDRVCAGYQNLITDYTDFPDHLEHAKEALASFQEAYLQRRISYLESRASEEAFAAEQKETTDRETAEALGQITDRMRMWEPIEEALYMSWSNMNDKYNLDTFYDDQKLMAVSLTGIVEAYNSPVKSKPGDFVLRDRDLPIAYVYSTQVNLQSLIGKKVTLKASPRPNNNFAFPAYFVLEVE